MQLTLPADVQRLQKPTLVGEAFHGNTPFRMARASEIADNLWVGANPEGMLPAYFESVLNLYAWEPYLIPQGTRQRIAPLLDGNKIDERIVHELAEWVNARRWDGPTLVHCQLGLNRSGLVAGLALIKSGMTADAAIRLLREKRSPAVLCNRHFEKWLRAQQ